MTALFRAPIFTVGGSHRRLVVSFMPWPLYPLGNSPWYPLDRRLGWLHKHSGHCRGEKTSHPCQESNHSIVGHCYTNCPIISLLPPFLYKNDFNKRCIFLRDIFSGLYITGKY
jgi:hypothetical protein